MSPVEQIALTVNIAIRRDIATLDYYQFGSSPDAFATLPKEWTADQIRSFQDYFDALMSGNLARRRMTKFMPADFQAHRERASRRSRTCTTSGWRASSATPSPCPPRPSSARSTARPARPCACRRRRRGSCRLKAWVKNALDHVIQVCMNEPGLEFVWVGDDAIDPLQQAQTLQILVSTGIKTREEARADLGLGAGGKCRRTGAGWGSSIRITTSRGGSRRRTERLPPWAARRASRGLRASRSRAWTTLRLTLATPKLRRRSPKSPSQGRRPLCQKRLPPRKGPRPRRLGHLRTLPPPIRAKKPILARGQPLQKSHRRGQPQALPHRARQTRMQTLKLCRRVTRDLLVAVFLPDISSIMETILAQRTSWPMKIKLDCF